MSKGLLGVEIWGWRNEHDFESKKKDIQGLPSKEGLGMV